jgi:hypothetical protein
VVLVRDQAQREKLAEAMLQANIPKVQQAPVIAVFAADLGTLVARLDGMMESTSQWLT